MHWVLSLVSLLLLCRVICPAPQPSKCTQLGFLPMPVNITCTLDAPVVPITRPCSIHYVLVTGLRMEQVQHVKELLQYQQYRTFNCRRLEFVLVEQPATNKGSQSYVVNIKIAEPALRSAFTVEEEKYSLRIGKQQAEIECKHYVGFVRALETFMQAITCDKHYRDCGISAVPISISDQPVFEFRGLMIDTARHFLPLELIRETIDAMMYNKLNVLHWHITDEDSFPLLLDGHPELAHHASFSLLETFSPADVRHLVHYAMVRGVRVVPEIDTPGHSASWARAPQNAQVACNTPKSRYRGSLDVTLTATYRLMSEVFQEVFRLFPDPLVHLGGDQVELHCFKNKTEFMRLEKVKESQIEMQYRKIQKKMLKQLDPSKTFIYWITDNFITEVEQDDVIHWWGKKELIPSTFKDRKIIASAITSPYYIDKGVGNVLGKKYWDYSTWLELYSLNLGQAIRGHPNEQNVIGGEVTLWSEVSNLYTHHTKIWIRSSAMAERVWTSVPHRYRPDFLRRLTLHEKLMNRRGIPTSPATSQRCEIDPSFC